MPLRMGVDATCWPNRRGFGRFTRALVGEMVRRGTDHHWLLFIDAASRARCQLPAGVEARVVPVSRPPAEAASAAGGRSPVDIARMSWAARRAACDAFFFPASYSYFPVVGPPTVVTVHDAIAEAHAELTLPNRAARLRWKAKQQLATRTAAAVVTVSEAAKEDVIRALPVSPERVHVITEAPDPVFAPAPPGVREPVLDRFGLGPDRPYLLYVGGISPHKNVDVLVRAFTDLAADFPDLALVLVGELHDDPFLSSAVAVKAQVEASPTAERVTFTGYLPDDDVAGLYRRAVATVLPSVGEGFGLTAAESAACGTPVVASDIPALRELLGDAALYTRPGDSAALAAACRRLLEDPARRQHLAQECRRRSERWSWTGSADAVIALLERSARSRRRRPA